VTGTSLQTPAAGPFPRGGSCYHRGMPPSEATQATCPRCEGRGWLVSADGGAGTARPCTCREAARGSRLLEAAGIPERYRHCKLASFMISSRLPAAQRDQLVEALAVSKRYVESFLDAATGRFRETGLLFSGRPGVGKTHLAVGVLHDLVEQYRVRGRFADFGSLLHQIQATFDPSSAESKHEVLDPLIEAEVLVLDELGAQEPTPWVRDVLYLIINQRYGRRLPTLFTTNYRLQPTAAVPSATGPRSLDRGADPEPLADAAGQRSLASRISPMLVSRLYEMTLPVLLDAVEDYRREQKSFRTRV
jgi:DNA replication protein DnaC